MCCIENNSANMDPRALDAGVGEVPNHPVDTDNPNINGTHHSRHVLPESVLRSYPLVSELAPASNRGVTTLLPSSPTFPHRPASGVLSVPAPTHHVGHIITDKRAG